MREGHRTQGWGLPFFPAFCFYGNSSFCAVAQTHTPTALRCSQPGAAVALSGYCMNPRGEKLSLQSLWGKKPHLFLGFG